MRIISFKCDCCGYEKYVTLPCGMQIPRILWAFGNIEVCDICSERINVLIGKEKQKIKKEHEPYEDKTFSK